MNQNRHGISRRSRGETLVSVLVATVLMSIAASTLLALMILNTKENSGFWNKADVVMSARDGLDRIGRLVRTARSLGDMYGLIPPTTKPDVDITQLTPGTSTNVSAVNVTSTNTLLNNPNTFLISSVFPAAGDPYYGNGNTPPQGWPNWPPQTQPLTAPGRYYLSPDTLIIQVPAFGPQNSGPPNFTPVVNSPVIWPMTYNGLPPGGTNGSLEAMDTYVFRVFPDPNPNAPPNTYIMQEACFQASPPNQANPSGTPANFNAQGFPNNAPTTGSAPVTLMTGIVGPLDPNNGNTIAVFKYVEKVNNTATANPPDAGHLLSDYSGVVVDVEVLKKQEGVKAAVAAFRSEFYFRNNSMATLMGPPAPG